MGSEKFSKHYRNKTNWETEFMPTAQTIFQQSYPIAWIPSPCVHRADGKTWQADRVWEVMRNCNQWLNVSPTVSSSSLVQLRLMSESQLSDQVSSSALSWCVSTPARLSSLHQIHPFADSYLNKMEWSAYAGGLKLWLALRMMGFGSLGPQRFKPQP